VSRRAELTNGLEDSDEPIYPTHRCFDDIVDFFRDLAEKGTPAAVLNRFTVVHGILLSPEGEPYAHGWVERDDGLVIQTGIYRGERILFALEREEFLVSHMVWDETRYTLREVLRNDRTLGYPPWIPEYRDLCSSEKRAWHARSWKP